MDVFAVDSARTGEDKVCSQRVRGLADVAGVVSCAGIGGRGASCELDILRCERANLEESEETESPQSHCGRRIEGKVGGRGIMMVDAQSFL